MNASIVGAHLKYVFVKKLPALSLEAGGSYVVDGRNVGQATEFNGSVFYIIPFSDIQKLTLHIPANFADCVNYLKQKL